MFTQRALLLGFVGFCFYLIAVVNTLPSFYYVLTWLSLGLLAASLGIALLSLSGLQVTGRFSRRQGVSRLGARHLNSLEENSKVLSNNNAGSMPLFEMTLENKGSLNKTGVILELQFRSIFDAQEQGANAPIGAHQFLLEAIPAGQTLEISLPLSLLSRGKHELVQARLLGSDVLGLFRVSRRLRLTSEAHSVESDEAKIQSEVENAEIVVAPPLFDDVAGTLMQGLGHGLNGSRRSRQFGRGDDVRALRPYVAGDDLRHIHWKTTARTGAMVVKEWEYSSRSSALVIWDGSIGSNDLTEKASVIADPSSTKSILRKFLGPQKKKSVRTSHSNAIDEVGLSVAASMVAAFHRAELPCSSVILSEKPAFLPGGGSYGGALSIGEIEAFAGAQANRVTPFDLAFDQSGCNESLFDVIYLVSAKTAPSVVGPVARWVNRGAVVFVILLDDVPLAALKNGKSEKRPKLLGNKKTVTIPTQDVDALRRTGATVAEISLEMLVDEPSGAALDEISLDSAQLLEAEIRRVMIDLNQ